MLNYFVDSGIIIALLGVLGTFVKSVFDNRRLMRIKQEDIETATKERKLILRGLIVVLRKLNDDNVNGDVEKTISAVEDFLIDASHKNSPRDNDK